jgi:hypothetical protein
VGAFDEAFISRIHVQIYYEALDDEAREKIWNYNFEKLDSINEETGHEVRWSYKAREFVREDSKLKKLEWNGREIRNGKPNPQVIWVKLTRTAFQTAVALATHDAKSQQGDAKPTVTESHMLMIVKMSAKFQEYMRRTRQNTPAEIATLDGMRYDKPLESRNYRNT